MRFQWLLLANKSPFVSVRRDLFAFRFICHKFKVKKVKSFIENNTREKQMQLKKDRSGDVNRAKKLCRPFKFTFRLWKIRTADEKITIFRCIFLQHNNCIHSIAFVQRTRKSLIYHGRTIPCQLHLLELNLRVYNKNKMHLSLWSRPCRQCVKGRFS